MKGIATFLLESAVDSVHKRRNDLFEEGYIEAANVCLETLSKEIQGLLDQISSGNYLSDKEQFLFAKLTELKAGTESALRDSLERRDDLSDRVDERP